MISVTLYSNGDCHLCEETIADLHALQEHIPHLLTVVNIEGKRELERAYALDIPVLEVGPYRLKAPITRQDLEITLKAASERERDIQSINQATLSPARPVTRGDRFTRWFANHYILVLNLIVLIYVGLPFLAPVLMAAGLNRPAGVIYKVYSATCHQFAYRSWFLFGDQAAYPREAAHVANLVPYGVATGLSEEDQFASREFLGNPTIGYKVALCQRDVAIYGGILAFGLLFSLTGRRMKSLPWYLWIIFGMLPIAMDGLSQLLSQPPLNAFISPELLSFRESTPFLRTLTGFLFGFTTAWFGYPLVEETMADTRRYIQEKFNRATKVEVGQSNPAGEEQG
jgi:uncharacterized membrane protein